MRFIPTVLIVFLLQVSCHVLLKGEESKPPSNLDESVVMNFSETFDIAGEGVAGDCSSGVCDTDVPPANGQWSIGGDLSGLNAPSDFVLTIGGELVFQDTDTEVCFLSSVVNSSGLPSTVELDLSELGGLENADYVDVSLIADGTSTKIIDWEGLGSSNHTLIGAFGATTIIDCVIGSNIQVEVCALVNAGSEQIMLDNVSISETSSNPFTCESNTITVYLDETGFGSVDFDEVFVGSSGVCAEESLIFTSNGCIGGNMNIAEFSCCDINMPVVATITDTILGVFCFTPVEVRDTIPPNISCPPQMTITCDEVPADGLVILQGPNLLNDNCASPVTVSVGSRVETPLPNCGELISVTFTAIDGSSFSSNSTCTSSVIVEHVSDFIVQFPQDIVVDCSTISTGIPEPIIIEDECENIGITTSDTSPIFDSSQGNYVFTRTYTIINHCIVTDPAAGGFTNLGTPLPIPNTFRDDDGFFQYTQTITIDDLLPSPPTVADVTFCEVAAVVDVVPNGEPGNTFSYYSDAMLTNLLSMGLTYTPIGTLGIETIFVTQNNNDCESEAVQVNITVLDCASGDFDLATRLTLSAGEDDRVYPGETISFDVEIFNQGMVVAQNIEVILMIPGGLISATGIPNMGIINFAGPLAPGASVVQTLDFIVDPNINNSLSTNLKAEIIGAQDEFGASATDIDSTPDVIFTNDVTIDNEIFNGGGDEDDADVEEINIEIFDLALVKVLAPGEDNRVYPGEVVTFRFEVFNQGTVSASNIVVEDYVPVGLIPVGPTSFTIAGPLSPGSISSFTLSFVVNTTNVGALQNSAEIQSAQDDFGNTPPDFDSIADADPSNDAIVNDATDNEGGDEDDSDVELVFVEIFDLALEKTTINIDPVNPGDDILFTITVFNQGSVSAESVEIIDYLPSLLVLSGADTNGWTVSGGTLTNSIFGPISPGSSASVDLLLTLQAGAAPGSTIDNIAEITAGTDDFGENTVDFDSTFDNIEGNDPVGEDDFGIASFVVCDEIMPPTVMDITVCEGESTLITPEGDMSGGGTMASTVYLETFDTDGEGIAGACGSMAASSCTTNVPPANGQWFITGNTSGITATSDFAITSGGVLEFQDTDTEVCFTTTTIDISGCTTSDFAVDISELGAMESTDYVDVNLIIDGISNPIINWTGLGDATHTLIDDFTATTVFQTGIVGSTIVVEICVLNNSGGEQFLLDNIVVGCEGSGSGITTFKYFDTDPAMGATPIAGPTTDPFNPMTSPGDMEMIWVTACVGTCESQASKVTIVVNELPSAPSETAEVYCEGDVIPDIVPVGEAGALFSYYSDAALMNLLQTGTSYTPIGTVGIEFIFITQTVNGCESEGVQSSVEVLPTPEAPLAESLIFCIGEQVEPVEAVGDPTASFTYYNDAALTTIIANGAIYTPIGTPGIETVFVTQTVNGCESAATEVTITIAGFENVTATPSCNAGVLDYCLDISFEFAGPGPSNMFEVVVNGFIFGPFPYGVTGMETITLCDPVNFIGDEQEDLVVEVADVDRGNVTAGITQTGGGTTNTEGCVEIGSILPAQLEDNNGDGAVDFCDEFITLTNGGTAIIDISGYTISDAITVRHIFPTVTILNPGQTITLFNSDMNQLTNCAGLGIWNNGGDDIILNDAAGGLVDMETYTGSTNGVEITFEVIGCGMGMTTNTGASSCLQINSVLANQTSDNNGDGVIDFCDEFITITNPGNMPLDISGYTISDGVALRHIFPSVTILNPGQVLTIFNSDLSQLASCVGVWNNGGDNIVITDASGAAVDMETYGGAAAGIELFFSLEACPILEVDPMQVCSGLIEFDEPNCCPVIEVASFMGMSICAGSCPAAGEGLMAVGECGNIATESMTRWFSDPAGMFLVFEGDVFDPISEGLVDNNVVGETVFYAQVNCDFCLSDIVPIKVEIFDCNPPNDACGGCTYFVQLYDSAFNGWDGAQFLLSINEGPFVEYKPTAEDNGCLFFPIDIIDGGSIDYMYHAGANAEEHSYKIIDAFGQVVASEGMQFTGNNIEAGVEQTVKADCPACCDDAAELFTFVFTAGNDAFEKSWEIRDNNGERVAFANAGEYAGVFNGQSVNTNLLLDPCEEYTITTFAARNNGWEGGTYQLLSSNPERGILLLPGIYQVAQGPDTFTDELSTDFTLPCSIECPDAETILADDLGSCVLTSYTAPLIDAPICSPNNCHFNPTPMLEVCYPTAIGGLVEGPLGTTSASLPVGTNPVVYKVIYSDGQIRRCTSEVHVISEVNPVLVCNDLVILPLPFNTSNCEAVITADLILENPDPCNAQYLIELTDANGNNMGNVVDFSDAGQTFSYSVTQIGTGLSAICEGEVFIEDKLAPTIECFDYEINCNHPNALDELYSHTETFEVTPSELPGNIAGGTAMNPSELFLPIPDVGCGPHGEIIQDVNVSINLEHNDLEDLTILLIAPNGTTITLLERRTCNNGGSQNMNVTFDSEANTPVFAACSPGLPGLTGNLRPAQPLSLLYNLPYEDFQGDWTILVRDDDDTAFEGIGIGEVLSASLEITAGFPFPYAAIDCNLESVTLIYEGIEETNCDQGDWLGANVVRVWQAKDVFGNVSECTQTVGLRAPRLVDFDLPEDIELECGDVPSDPALLTADLSGETFFECFNLEDSQSGLCDVVITFVDKVSPLCGNSYQINREWELTNLCSNTVLNHEQVIVVKDSFGPAISQANIVVGTNEESCSANVDLVDLAISDACSEVTDVTATYLIGSSLTIVNLTNGEIIEDLPFGANTVTLSATDACGNTSTEDVTITIVDDVIPTATCNDGLNITLSDSGIATLTAVEFDEGSLDNCSDVTLLVRSLGCEGGAFGPSAEFGCCDVGTVRVELLATDAAGNSNICWADVLVEDVSAPSISCQDDVTINCDDDDVNVADLFEEPIVSDNCNTSISESEIIEVELPNCGQLLTKTYTVSDGSDKSEDVSCVQSVTILHTSDFIVQFPADQDFDACTLGDIPGPIVTEDDCEMISVSSEDRVFTQVDDACYLIERTYTIINHCIVDDPSVGGFSDLGTPLPIPRTFRDDDGYFQYTQIIKVNDEVAPTIVFTAPEPCDFTDGCEGMLALTATGEDSCADLADLTFSWSIDEGSTGIFESEGTGADASGTYPYGDHIIKWTVSDGCGNTTTEEFDFSVQDCKNPTPVCQGVSTVVMNNGDCVRIWALDLLDYAEDNCTERTEEEWRENARVRFAGDNGALNISIELCCADLILGNVPVEVWVEDEAGNADFCIVNVNIQDNMGNCDDNGIGAATLIGSIKTEVGVGVSEVELKIDGQDMAMTNAAGDYGILLETNNAYKVEPVKVDNPGLGVSTFDLVLMTQHVLQINSLDGPYKMIAADVNLDGSIDIFDLLEVRQLVLFIIDNYSVVDSWVFVPTDYSFQDPSNPLNENYPLFMDVDLDTDQTTANFTAIKMGDLDGSAMLNGEVEERSFPSDLSFVIEDNLVQAGDIQKVDFRASDFNNISGYQFTLGFDPANVEILNMEPGALNIGEGNFGKALLHSGRLTSSFNIMGSPISVADEEILFSIEILAKQNIKLSETLSIVDEYTLAESYQGEGGTLGLNLVFNSLNLGTRPNFALYQNTPNPFKDQTVISFELPTSTAATLTIFDVTGKVLYQVRADYNAGYNSVEISANYLNVSGLVYYTLETAEQKAERKMLIIK